jgi:hypothetical protein
MLAYLSFHFASQELEKIKFYSTDILFHSTTDQDSYAFKNKNKITWNFINVLVNEQIKTKQLILQKRKAAYQSFDLFLIANKVLIKIKQMPLKKSKCSKCSNPRFHLIKLNCCSKFMCNPCLVEFHIGKTNCEICKTRCETNTTWFRNIRPQNKHFENWIPRLGNGAITFNIFANSVLQYWMLLSSMNTKYFTNMLWVVVHFVGVSLTVERTSFMVYDFNSNQNIPKHLHENFNIIFTELITILVTWSNLLVGFYLGHPFLSQSLLFTFVTLPIMYCIFFEFRKRIYSYVEEEIRYEFL